MDKDDMTMYVGKTVYLKLKGSRFSAGKVYKITNYTVVIDRGGEGYEERSGQFETHMLEDVIGISSVRPNPTKEVRKMMNDISNNKSNKLSND